MSGRYPARNDGASPWSCAFAIAEATADLTMLRTRRVPLGAMVHKRDETADDRTEPAPRAEQAALDETAECRREQPDVAELARVAGPERLVAFGAPQHVELGGALVDGRAD